MHAAKIHRKLLKLGGPILVVQMLQVSLVTIDTIMAGQYSATDLSGVGIGSSIWFPVFLFLFGLLSALTPTVAQLHGAKKHDHIAQQVYQGVWIALLISPGILLLLLSLENLLDFIGVADDVRPISIGYLNAMAFGLTPLLLYNVLRFYSDGVSLTKPAIVASFIGLLINAPLNYVLIYGKLGLPEMGGIGCGWASAISYTLVFLIMAGIVARKKTYGGFYLYDRFYGLHPKSVSKLLRLGLPIGLSHFVESSMFCVIALFLASLGSTIVAAHQIALNVSALVFMIPLSLSMALTIRVGFLVGSKQPREARATAFYGLGLAVFYAVFSASLLYFLRVNIAQLYNKDQAVIALSSTLIIYTAVFQIGDALQVTAAGALRGYKDTRPAMYIMLLTFWCFGLPLGYALGLSELFGSPMHAEGFWTGLVVGLFLAATLLIWRLNVIANGAFNLLR